MSEDLSLFSNKQWQNIGIKRRAGVLVPLFSVYSKDSFGIGDLEDLKLVIDWAVKTGNSIIQLLPMNELGSIFCPYDSLSSFALEPVYLSLRSLPQGGNANIKGKIKNLKKSFPIKKDYLDYGIKAVKINLLREMFSHDNNSNTEGLKCFAGRNAYWINDFVLYKVLKDYHSGKPWYEWEDKYKYRDKQSLETFYRESEKEILFQIWVQWQLSKQFDGIKYYAESKNVLLKGDLPILVSRDSADVWAHPEFFKLEFASGAPADMYCAKGQRWGMPVYNWNAISNDGYRYLKEKLKFAENFYHLLRIDHVVGLFRIWSIPYDDNIENQGLNGSYYPREENKWGEQGKEILSVMLDNTKMLLCAEDLGIIPKVCTDTLKELGIPGNDVQRWVKDWNVRHDFLLPEEYRELSVTMLSTHDTTNWAAWWEYEAGTVDQVLFIRKCGDRGIDYASVRDKLFDLNLSNYSRLRWLNTITSVDTLVAILGKPREEIADFIEMYENTYREKEKLWSLLGLTGAIREKSDREILSKIFGITLNSRAIFSIETVVDYLYLTGELKRNPYEYRINTPGTISEKNWSLILPLSLEDLLKHKVCDDIRGMITAGRRLV